MLCNTHTHKGLLVAKGVFRAAQKRINLTRTVKISRLLVDLVQQNCDNNDMSFSQFLRNGFTESLTRAKEQKQQSHHKVFVDTLTSAVL
jgi:hypothetical protein